jgi:hypothetical protein
MSENSPEVNIEGDVENVNVPAPEKDENEAVKGNDDPADDYKTENNGNPE